MLTGKMLKRFERMQLNELISLDKWLHELMTSKYNEELEANPNREIVETRRMPTGTFRLELVKCGKDRCKKCRQGPAHGPYWYRYYKLNGKTHSQYIGKELSS